MRGRESIVTAGKACGRLLAKPTASVARNRNEVKETMSLLGNSLWVM